MRVGECLRTGICGLLFASLTGCLAVGPDYHPPDLSAPAAWTQGEGDNRPAGALEDVAWWKAFGDPILDDLVDRALAGNLDIAQAKARIRQARADLRTARAGFFPSIEATGSSTTSDSGLIDAGTKTTTTTASSANTTASSSSTAGASTTGGSGTTTSATSEGASSGATSTAFTAGFDATWELDVFGGQRRSFEAAKATLQASIEDLRATRLTLLGDVATYYVALRAYQEQLDITRKNVDTQRQNAEVTRERFRLGLITQLDVAQAEGEVASTAADIPSLQSSIKESIHRLGILLGLPPGALVSLLAKPRPLPGLSGPILATGLPSELLSRRPDVRKAERTLAAASAAIGVATADLYPKFDLTAGLGLAGASPSTIAGFSTWYWSVVPGLTWNLFDAGKTLAAVDKKKALYDEALASYQATFHTALEDVENALAAFYAQQEREKQLAASVGAYEEARTLANERYTKGLTTFLTVLVNETSLYEAQTNLTKARANVRTNLIALYKALGGGWNVGETAVAPGA